MIKYGEPICSCCGEKHLEFLAVDHIEGGGIKHRKEFGGGSTNFYDWIVKQGFPVGLRILCHNCNCAIGFYGHCPHKKGE